MGVNSRRGEGGGLLPYKGLMGTCSQPGYVFRDFCLKQGIGLSIFCLKQDIFSWTMKSKIFTSSCELILTSVDFGIDTRHIKLPLITQQESHTACNRNFKRLKQGTKNRDSVLNSVGKSVIFVLNKVRV